jgi:hypothetical protein
MFPDVPSTELEEVLEASFGNVNAAAEQILRRQSARGNYI